MGLLGLTALSQQFQQRFSALQQQATEGAGFQAAGFSAPASVNTPQPNGQRNSTSSTQEQNQRAGTPRAPGFRPAISLAEIMQLAERDFTNVQTRALERGSAVEAHEAAHQSAGGAFAGGIHLDFETISLTMPDGSVRNIQYANAGHVPIHMPEVPLTASADPAQRKLMEQRYHDFAQIQAAALAPASLGGEAGELSGADLAIAAQAEAQQSLMKSLMSRSDQRMAERQQQQNQLALLQQRFPQGFNPTQPQSNAQRQQRTFQGLTPLEQMLLQKGRIDAIR